MNRGNRMRGTALRDEVACTSFALATLGGHAKFELDFVEGHAGSRMTRDFSVGHSAADADDHGEEAAVGWLLVKA